MNDVDCLGRAVDIEGRERNEMLMLVNDESHGE